VIAIQNLEASVKFGSRCEKGAGLATANG